MQINYKKSKAIIPMPLFKKFKTDIKKLSQKRDHAHIPDHVLDQALDIASGSLENRKPSETKITIIPSKKKDKGDKHDQTLIVMVTDDRPFLIDSITAECVDSKFVIEGVLHNTVLVDRQKGGKLKSLEAKTKKNKDDLSRESFLIVTLQGILGDAQRKVLEGSLQSIVTDVEFATRDWADMRQVVQDTIDGLDNVKKASDKHMFDEYKAFLNYLYENNFTLLGYREYKLNAKGKQAESKIVKGSGLGLLSDDKKPVYINKSRQNLPSELQQKRINQPTVTVAKVNKRSTVHRKVPMDAIAVKTYDDKGNVTGEKLFIGLFTSVTYSRSIQDIPYLRHKVNTVLEKTGYGYNSHNYRALMHILEKYPRDELFQIDVSLLQKYAVSIMALQEQPRMALYVREDPFKRYVSCLVYFPRDKYETDLRVRVQDILEDEFGGVCESFQTVLDDSPLARVIYRIKTTDGNLDKKFNNKKIEDKLIKTARSWGERIRVALLSHCEEEKEALSLTEKYSDAFPAGYIDQATAEEAYFDIQKIEEVLDRSEFAIDLYKDQDADDHLLNLKIYHPNSPVTLSDILPILENFGFTVIAEKPFRVNIGDKNIWIHDFDIQYRNPDHAMPVKDIKDVFEEGYRAIWNKDCENDALNSLISKVKMPWRDVLVLRALVKYMRQTKIQYTPQYMMRAVTDHPDIADLMLEYFYGRHKPSHSANNRKKLMLSNKRKILKKLEDVSSYDQDRILRSMLQIMESALRTNFFQNKTYVSFKLDSTQIDILPLPKPYVEIFVYSPRTEGVHLRGGKVARGGLRWSDRHEDFRTEVLGLMKAQNVKNSVIIPVGSKGGFVVKNPPKTGGREEFQKEGIECYKIFISGLLDITDNLKGKKTIPPKDVVRHDDDDPYLVVAADKGTATFSDIANGLADDYSFWLSDAFASGGSAGYDHKAMGITAKGAWESVKRHFRELGLNTQKQEFDVIGVGDMGGDVFGNGMLLSKYIRLIGAFNHLHIFCDPTPDVSASFKERQRLFKAVKGWDAYNEKILSKGGRIYSRSDKSLKLTPEIQSRFGIDKKEVSPQELMHAILQSETDLMWFGGIGTYIKAPNESHADVGDKANDTIRIDAHQVRARVIGEGANLGATHAARICMNLLGVKCYADFIDNSGGVNSSDLEVNMQNTKLSVKDRNKILEKMTTDVADLVLRNNYQQTQAISMAAHGAYDKLSSHVALIEHLEDNFDLNREIENLPDNTAIENRSRDNHGLTTAELSTLISYTKIKLFQDLLDSNLPDDPAFQDWMTAYFPDLIQDKYKIEMNNHRLRREIIATQLANSIVNRMGPTYMMNQTSKTGIPACTIARVYFIVREVFDIRDLYSDIELLDNKAKAIAQIEALNEIADFIDYTSTWFLKEYKGENLKETQLINLERSYKKSFQKILKIIDKVLPESSLVFIDNRQSSYVDQGFSKDTARRIAMLPIMNTMCDIIKISDHMGHDLGTVAKVYFALNEALSFVWLRDQSRGIDAENRWESETLKGIVDRLYVTQAELTKRIVSETCSGKKCPTHPVEDWMHDNKDTIQPIKDMIDKIKSSEDVNFAMLTSAEVRLEQVV
jgi:glutamate dehydrogenase